MYSKENIFPGPEKYFLRNSIRRAIHEPMLELLMLWDYAHGIRSEPESTVTINQLSIPKVELFYEYVKNELKTREGKGVTEFSDDLQDSLDPHSKNQSIFDHEIAHVRAAKQQGVSLEHSAIKLFFTESSGFGLRLTHEFIPPEGTNPLVMALIALAPEEPSDPDFAVVKKVINTNRKIFYPSSVAYQQIATLYEQRTGKDLNVFLRS